MRLKLPVIIVNFKTYKESVGGNAVKLAKICEKVAKKTKTSIAVAVANPDIYSVAKAVSIPVLSEHVDAIGYGAHTGHIVPENVMENGAFGVLINHSEDRLSLEAIKKTVERAKEAKLLAVVCASTPSMVSKIAGFNPDFIAVEPPELIGGNISVSKARPEVITNSLKRAGKIPLLCGAGVKNREDVRIAVNLGAKGILVASGVTKAENPEKALIELVKGL